jgi:hypothetical protein
MGIQSSLEGKNWNQVVFDMFLAWDIDLFAEEDKAKKSFFYAVYAVQKFQALLPSLDLSNYEVAIFKGKPAVELSFRIAVKSGFNYRGFVDVVLVHKITGELLVLELKTTAMTNVDEAQYKNSGQALGYSVVLDAIAPLTSSYKVVYLIYKSKAQEYEVMEFTKSHTVRALWIQQLIMDVDLITMYEDNAIYPAYGESCYSFFRACEFFNLCGMSTARLIAPPPLPIGVEAEVKKEEYTLELNLMDLINSQLNKTI